MDFPYGKIRISRYGIAVPPRYNIAMHITGSPLGREVAYPQRYDPALLFRIDRAANRSVLAIPDAWHGADIWNAYELSWLNARGKPVVAVGRFVVPCSSPRLVESKSFKLYLNSFSETRHDNAQAVQTLMTRDLSEATGAPVDVTLTPLGEKNSLAFQPMPGICIDDLDIEIHRYDPAPELLRCLPDAAIVSETLVSNLLKSNCPVTGQPDWGSVLIRYTGPAIDRAALLGYVVSLRRHTEFHEHCVEKMYCDIWHACRPAQLMVHACYTRRGGLDINPWRGSGLEGPPAIRTIRQ